MKLFNLICLSLLIVSCSTNQTKEKTASIKKKTVSTVKDSIQVKEVIGKPFFDFDNVTHYQSKARNSILLLILKEDSITIKDSLEALTHLNPKIENLSDSNFIDNLSLSGFEEYNVEPRHYKPIQNLFSLKDQKYLERAACSPIYRDYMVFRNKNKISGIAIICFDCQQFKIFGSKESVDNFGCNGDFDKLRQILYRKRKK
tara:strand:- start:40 stop:642 length:603 start_codon:yes stop_codon:yes gene_type:complete